MVVAVRECAGRAYGRAVVEARRGIPEDAAELVRLRAVMLAAATGQEQPPGPWQAIAEESLRKRLAEPDPGATLAAFVIERPAGPGLAACALGTIERRLGDAWNPGGEYGYVFNVATDPEYRWRGYSRACMRGVLDWYQQRGVQKVDLKATGAGEPLYASLGFAPSLMHTPMRLRLPGPDAG